MGVSETYTDNLTLSSTNPQSDYISNVTPSIAILGTGRKISATVDYSLQSMFYGKQNQLDHAYSHLDANGSAELVERNLYLDANASIAQQPLTLTAPYGAALGNPTGNIVNVFTWGLKPYFRHRFGSTATGEVHFSHQSQNYSSGGPSNTGTANLGTLSGSTSDSTALSLNSGSAFNNLLWGLRYNNAVIHYTSLTQSRLSNYSANIGYLFSPKFRITFTLGNDNNSYASAVQSSQGSYWTTEAGWSPTSHTKLLVSTGRRYFGKTQSLSLNHVTRLTTLQMSYGQDVTSSILRQTVSPAAVLDQLLKAQIPDNAARQQAIQSMLASLGTQAGLLGQTITTNQIYLHKDFTVTMGINLPKSTIVLTAYDNKSSSLQQGNSFLPGSINYGAVNQTGGTASWNWKLSPKLDAHLNATLTTMDFPGQTLMQTSREFQTGLSRQFAHHLSGALSYRHRALSSPGNLNYVENAVIASLNYAE